MPNTKPPQLHENKRQNLKQPALNKERVGVIDQILWGVIKQHASCAAFLLLPDSKLLPIFFFCE